MTAARQHAPGSQQAEAFFVVGEDPSDERPVARLKKPQ
jgi:hypothetical protein